MTVHFLPRHLLPRHVEVSRHDLLTTYFIPFLRCLVKTCFHLPL